MDVLKLVEKNEKFQPIEERPSWFIFCLKNKKFLEYFENVMHIYNKNGGILNGKCF